MSDISVSTNSHHLFLPWQLSTVRVFSALRQLSYAVLLDSADANHADARFDIIAAEPLAKVSTTTKDGIELCQVQHFDTAGKLTHQTETTQEPLAVVHEQLTHYFPQPLASTLPFSGGAIMAMSYDLGRHYEQLPSHAIDDLAFPALAAGIYAWALIRDSQQPVGQQWQLVSGNAEMDLSALAARLQRLIDNAAPQFADFRLTSAWQTQLTKAQYLAKFAQIQDYLHSGDCYQINLTQRFNAAYQGDEWLAYQLLRASNAAPFSAFFQWDGLSVLSISPERFLKLSERGEIETKPIKGTAPRSADSTQDAQLADELQQSEKNRAENLMIVDLLRNDIGKVAAAGSVSVPALFAIESFPAVHHLVSTVTAQLPANLHASDLLRAAFPGGSITGAPKIRAMEIIDELEPSRRSIYCGSIGYISQDGSMDSSITIRTLLGQQGQLYCWAGGGIVADSEGEAEYQETFDKVSKILPILSPPTAN
ncbi:aminodeoxychorismate synthase component I [Shewanella sp.]|uniref:aminodeoxychorismate synthase component I n=1 Tax=Shewanella sp. TaxID=50422 RepID=UPI003A97B8C4